MDQRSPSHGQTPAVEHFKPTSGLFVGIVVVVGAVIVAALALLSPDEVPPEVGVGAILVGLLGWAFTLRPRVSLLGDFLILRGAVSTTLIPLGAIEEMAIRQVLAVRAGDRRYTSTAMGKSFTQLMKSNRRSAKEAQGRPGQKAPDFIEYVEDRIRQRINDALAKAGIRRGSPEQVALGDGVLTQISWPEVLTIGAAALAFVVVILV